MLDLDLTWSISRRIELEAGLHNLLNNDRRDYTTHGFLSRLVVSRELRGRFLLLTLRPKWLRMLPQPPHLKYRPVVFPLTYHWLERLSPSHLLLFKPFQSRPYKWDIAFYGSRVSHLSYTIRKRAPARCDSFPTLHNEMNSFCAAQMRHPYYRDCFFVVNYVFATFAV